MPIPKQHRFASIPQEQARSRGFTMIELMIATALSVIIMGSVMATFGATNRSFMAVSNYGIIHRGGRTAVDQFAKDFRKAIDIIGYGGSSISLSVPTGFSSQGITSGTKTIQYAKEGTNLVRRNLTSGTSKTLATDVTTVTFTMYNRLANTVSVTSLAKGVQVDIKLSRSVVGVLQTEDFLSARLMMRNKQ